MYEPQQQQLFDLQENHSGAYGDPSSWLNSLEHQLPRTSANGNVDPLLFNDLVQIVPLVQSLIDQKAKTSFTKRGSMTYTKMPSRESLYKKAEAKRRNAMKKHGEQNKSVGSNLNGCPKNFSASSSLTDGEELMVLREQVEDLQKKLWEKDELLKEAEILKDEMASTNAELDKIVKEISEKDSLLKSTQMQLSDVKFKLADMKASVERLEWAAITSSKKVERLQEDLDSSQEEISLFMKFVQVLTENDSRISAEEYDVIPHLGDHNVEIDQLNEREMQKLEEAREAYIAAVAAAKENQDESSLSAAGTARSYLQSLVLRT